MPAEEAGLDIDYDDPAAWDTALAGLQADSAGVEQPAIREVEISPGQIITSARTVELKGARFRIAESVGLMPMLKFSAHADAGMAANDPGALAAMYSMLKDCIHPGHPACGECEACEAGDEKACKDFDPGDWARFEHHAIDSKANAEELLDVIGKAMELIAGRPTEPPQPSSGGRRSTRAGSTARSSGKGRQGSRR